MEQTLLFMYLSLNLTNDETLRARLVATLAGRPGP